STPPLALIVLWYGLLFLSVWLSTPAGRAAVAAWWRRHYRPAGAVLLGGAVILLAVSAHGYREKPLRIHFIDVGQGDCILVETPGGKHMLVDAGGWQGEFDSGEGAGSRVVVPYLRRLGVRRLDVLVLTHPHEDHAGGAAAVAGAFPTGLAVVSPFGFSSGPAQSPSTAAGTGAPTVSDTPGANKAGLMSLVTGSKAFPAVIPTAGKYRPGSGRAASELSPAYTGLLSALAARGVSVKPAAAGDRLRLDPALQIDVLGPPRPLFQGTRSDANNNSVVIRISYGRQSILLTGDMEVEAQRALLETGAVPACTVLKMPHHGSRYFLPAFLEAARPAVTVISVGARNNFGQPAPETINLLEQTPARIYRTDLDGAVILTTGGKTWRVETGRRREPGGRAA
ncbi:ComEC/Rec2 family competence protein, partial [Desulfotomaculum copahuensis]|uniref:ComEC/Rec2 family competence protein n=1 Tax=Desulfotomaculum copahuensis TaxID=1838280 RepID=UPI000A50343A